MNVNESSFFGLRSLHAVIETKITCGLNLLSLDGHGNIAPSFDRVKDGLISRSSDGQDGYSAKYEFFDVGKCPPASAYTEVGLPSEFPVRQPNQETAEVEAQQPCTANVSRTVFVGNLDFKGWIFLPRFALFLLGVACFPFVMWTVLAASFLVMSALLFTASVLVLTLTVLCVPASVILILFLCIWGAEDRNKLQQIKIHANPATIRIFFKKFGSVKDVFLTKKYGNRTHKRIAFVKFAKMESAKRAIEATEEEATMDNRHAVFSFSPLRIFPATDRKRGKISHNESQKDDESQYNADAGVESVEEGSVELNDDAMLLVFKYLNAEDLLKVEKVNKRWRNLAMTAWACKQQLSFKNCFSPFLGTLMTNGLLKGILSRCGSNLKLLDISTISGLLDPSAVNIIGKYCQNVEVLDISGLHSSNEYMALLARSSVKLKKLTLGGNGTTGEKGIWSMLNNCKNLEYVDISHNNKATGKCFHKCGPKLQVLKLNCCTKVGPTGFEKIAQKCSEIVELHMNSCVKLTDQSLELICASCTKISIFDLGGEFAFVTAEGLSHIKHLHNLEELYLHKNKAVDDDLLKEIGRSCPQLRVLDVSACSNEISDVGVTSLSHCSKLSILNISYLENWTDDSLVSLSGSCPLTELITRACICVTDVGLRSVITMCPRLKLLDVSGCDLVTNATVTTALEAVSSRDNGLKLWITVGHTGIKRETLQCDVTDHPLLDVNFEDTCVKRFIPNFDSYWDTSDEDDYDDVVEEDDWMGYHDYGFEDDLERDELDWQF